MILDKRGGLAGFDPAAVNKIELGCGASKRSPDALGIDLLDYDGVDIVGDVFATLEQIPDASIDSVYSSHFFEHIADVPRLLSELGRVMRNGAVLEVIVPHFSNPYFYSDITHKTFFGLYTFNYFAGGGNWHRRVPTYQRELQFDLVSIKLDFHTTPSFYGRRVFKKLLGYAVNCSAYTKELYEEMFCYMFPCYQIKYVLRRI